MSIKIFITIDTEEDQWGEYNAPYPSAENVKRIPLVQEIFDHYGAVPTYLVNYPVVQKPHTISILRRIADKGRCEIGTHCHPWNTPPFEEKINIRNSMLCNLAYHLLYRKLETLHQEIVNRLNVIPLCFRSGRWGFGSNVARAINQLGYKIDTSVTPFTTWANEGGPNFLEAPSSQYRFDPENILLPNPAGCILEVPPTIGFFQRKMKLASRVRKSLLHRPLSQYRLLGILDRLRIINYRWLSPEVCNGQEMVLLSKNFIQLGHTFLNMSFHSTSLLPGATPFVRNEEEFKQFLDNIDAFLKFALQQGMNFLPLSRAMEY